VTDWLAPFFFFFFRSLFLLFVRVKSFAFFCDCRVHHSITDTNFEDSGTIQGFLWATNDVVYAYGLNMYVKLSTDGGATFAPLWDATGFDVWKMALSPTFATDSTMLAVLRDPAGGSKRHRAYRSTDAGTTWTQLGDRGDMPACS